jgi:ABC-type nitrate/sulfonate/bicarbonate transport system permease component
MYVSPDGLGHLIAGWGASFQIPELLSGIVLAAALSIVVNEALRWYERRVGRWRASA